MTLRVSAPLKNDEIKALLTEHKSEDFTLEFVSKTGFHLEFNVITGKAAEDITGIIKGIIKATPYGNAIYFSVECKP
jgi:hypothetical protein